MKGKAVRKLGNKHGKSKTQTYKVWFQMHRRCYDKNFISYPRYGGTGVSVCERWNDYLNFLADMGDRPPGLTIGRKDNSLGYQPDNCRWETSIQQGSNKKNNHFIEWMGQRKTIAQWERDLGFKNGTLKRRIYCGWDVQKAMQAPIRISCRAYQ